MKEIADIINAYNMAMQQGRHAALATVVHVEGSSYRRPGARMLVTDDGRMTGAISGGCLEGDALRKALLVMQQQKPMLVTYDTTDEEDAKVGVQLGCNGIVHILIEPVVKDEKNNPVELLKTANGKRRDAVLATLFSLQDRKAAQPGTCMLLAAEGVQARAGVEEMNDALVSDAKEALASGSSAIKQYNHVTALVELVTPPVALIVFGAGNDALPLAQMAAVLGWQVTVVDGRSNYATQQRFPQVQRLLVAPAAKAVDELLFDSKTAAVLMTHNYNYDIVVLQQLLPLPLGYIGSLGPKKKMERMLCELAEKGIVPDEQQLAKLHGPTGLDIGAETSEEIALSILSEIKAATSGSNGASLRSKQTTIHAHAQC